MNEITLLIEAAVFVLIGTTFTFLLQEEIYYRQGDELELKFDADKLR